MTEESPSNVVGGCYDGYWIDVPDDQEPLVIYRRSPARAWHRYQWNVSTQRWEYKDSQPSVLKNREEVSKPTPCCSNEKRNINGGCDNCGDPCL